MFSMGAFDPAATGTYEPASSGTCAFEPAARDPASGAIGAATAVAAVVDGA